MKDLTKILKVGDKVWSNVIGECTINKIFNNETIVLIHTIKSFQIPNGA